MNARDSVAFICLGIAGTIVHAQKLGGPDVQIEAYTTPAAHEVFSIKIHGGWHPVLSAASLVHVRQVTR